MFSSSVWHLRGAVESYVSEIILLKLLCSFKKGKMHFCRKSKHMLVVKITSQDSSNYFKLSHFFFNLIAYAETSYKTSEVNKLKAFKYIMKSYIS